MPGSGGGVGPPCQRLQACCATCCGQLDQRGGLDVAGPPLGLSTPRARSRRRRRENSTRRHTGRAAVTSCGRRLRTSRTEIGNVNTHCRYGTRASTRLDSQLWRRGNGGAVAGSTPEPPVQLGNLCMDLMDSGALCRVPMWFRPLGGRPWARLAYRRRWKAAARVKRAVRRRSLGDVHPGLHHHPAMRRRPHLLGDLVCQRQR